MTHRHRHGTMNIVAPCRECDGTGKIDKPEFKGTCLHCDGMGRVVFSRPGDVKLFYAAPDLLEACKQIVWKLSHNEKSEHYQGPGRVTRNDATVRMAVAAIAKTEEEGN